MKRILLLSIVAFTFLLGLFSNAVHAFSYEPTPGTQKKFMSLVYMGNAGVSNEEEARSIIANAIDEQMKLRRDFSNMDNAAAQELFDNYLLNNDYNPDDTELGRGFIPKRADLAAMAREAGVDYVLFVNAKITDTKVKTAWLAFSPVKYEVTALYNVLIYSVADNKYVYNQKYIVKENAAGTSSTERAFKKACIKFVKKDFTLQDINLDTPVVP